MADLGGYHAWDPFFKPFTGKQILVHSGDARWKGTLDFYGDATNAESTSGNGKSVHHD